jgi:hypothetical protein
VDGFVKYCGSFPRVLFGQDRSTGAVLLAGRERAIYHQWHRHGGRGARRGAVSIPGQKGFFLSRQPLKRTVLVENLE